MRDEDMGGILDRLAGAWNGLDGDGGRPLPGELAAAATGGRTGPRSPLTLTPVSVRPGDRDGGPGADRSLGRELARRTR